MPTITSGGPSNAWADQPDNEPIVDETIDDVQDTEPVKESTTSEVKTPDAATVRAWAKENNIPVNDRGALPAALVQQYQDAQK